MSSAFTIAIDGPAAAGKGTISKAVARHFDVPHLDTGLLYRATALKTLRGIAPVEAAEGLQASDLQAGGLRNAEVAEAASVVAAIPEVRAALIAFQKQFARQCGGAVLDGRDIGTVICPEAEAKLFVTARPEIRAERRYAELSASGAKTSLAEVLSDVKARDERDMNRSDAPLKPAPDALLLDTSDLSIDAAIARAIQEIKARLTG